MIGAVLCGVYWYETCRLHCMLIGVGSGGSSRNALYNHSLPLFTFHNTYPHITVIIFTPQHQSSSHHNTIHPNKHPKSHKSTHNASANSPNAVAAADSSTHPPSSLHAPIPNSNALATNTRFIRCLITSRRSASPGSNWQKSSLFSESCTDRNRVSNSPSTSRRNARNKQVTCGDTLKR